MNANLRLTEETQRPEANGQGHAEPARPLAPGALLLTLDDVARAIQQSRREVERMERDGEIGPVRVQLGRRVFFVRAEIELWVASHCPNRATWIETYGSEVRPGSKKRAEK